MGAAINAEKRVILAERLFGWVPHLTQREWLLDDSRVKVAACGRRWGKTEAAAVDAATFAIASPGSVQMIVSPSYDQSRLIFDTIEKMVFGKRLTKAVSKVTRTPYPRMKVGKSLITARTADDDGRNLRGHSADRVIVDEAAYVRDAVVDEVIGPMLADRDGQLVLISTPFGKNHFYRSFVSGQQPEQVISPVQTQTSEADGCRERGLGNIPSSGPRRYSSYRFPSWSNPFISRDYVDFQRNILTPRQFAVEYEAEFLDDQTSVFSWDIIQSAVALGRSSVDSEEPWMVAGIDWARYSDFTAVIVVDVASNPHRVIAIDRFNKLSWESQVKRVADILRKYRVNAVLTDQTSIGDPLLEQLRKMVWEAGVNVAVEGLTFTNSSKREIIDNLVLKLSHQELAIPDDEQLIRELQFFEYELTGAGNIRMNARSGYTDDLISALALAEWQGRSHKGAARFLTSGRARDSIR